MPNDSTDSPDPSTLDDLVRRLAELDDTLRNLPPESYELRFQLKVEQDELRQVAAGWGAEALARRSDEALQAEARSIRAAIDRLFGTQINMVSQMQARIPPQPSEIALNRQILEAGGIDKLRQRLVLVTAELELRRLE
jgi:hypothetical protein